MMSRLLRASFVVLLLTVAFSGADEQGWEAVDRKAVTFDIEEISGATLTDRVFEGKVVVIDFWATWCGPCVQELPELGRFSASLEGRKDVAFLSFSVDDDKADVVRFFENRKEKFPVYMASSLSDRMDVMIFPTKLIIDGRKGAPGRIRLKKEGVVEAGELEARVAEILNKP